MSNTSLSIWVVFSAYFVVSVCLFFPQSTKALHGSGKGGDGGSVPVPVPGKHGTVVMEDQRWVAVSTEFGEIAVAKVSDGKDGFYDLQFITMEPNSLFVPVLLHSDMVFYVKSGSGTLSWVDLEKDKKKLRQVDLRTGDVYRLLTGSFFYLQSNLETESRKFRITAIFSDSKEEIREGSSFGAYSSVGDLLLGFDDKVLQAALNVDEVVLQELRSGGRQQMIVHGVSTVNEMFEMHYRNMRAFLGLMDNGMIEVNKNKKGKAFNILEAKHDVENCNGWSLVVTSKQTEVLKDSDFGIFLVNLTKGSMMGPHWNPLTAEIAVVLNGSGMVHVVCPSTLDEAECNSSRFRVEEGDVFVVPRYHPMAQISFNNGSFVFLGFTTTQKNNHPQYLVGSASVFQVLDKRVLAATLGVSNTTMDEILSAQNDAIILECTSCAEEEERLMEEKIQRQKEEEAKEREEKEREEEAEEEARQQEEARREQEEAQKRAEEEAKREQDEARKREQEIARREQEAKRRQEEEEAARQQEAAARQQEEAQKRQEEAARREQEEQETKRRQEEEETARQKEDAEREQEEAQKREEEAARREEEAKRRQEEEEAVERWRQQEEEAATRRRHQEEEAAEEQEQKAERRRQEEEELARQKKEQEEAARRKQEEEEAIKKQEEATRQQAEEAAARRQQAEQEAAAQRQQAEQEAAAQRQQAEQEAAARRQQEQEEAARKQEEAMRRQEEYAARQQEAARKQEQEEAAARKQEQARRQQQQEEEYDAARQQEESIRQQQEEAEAARQQEAMRRQQEEAASRQQEAAMRRKHEEETARQQEAAMRQKHEEEASRQQEEARGREEETVTRWGGGGSGSEGSGHQHQAQGEGEAASKKEQEMAQRYREADQAASRREAGDQGGGFKTEIQNPQRK